MKEINGYWTDASNNNKWDVDIYTLQQAEYLSSTLINCSDCHNCRGCRDCHGCRGCRDCHGCSDCHNCRGCNGCCGCHGYTANPQNYTTRCIGSRKAQTTFYYGSTRDGMSLQVVCGCFRGDLQSFAAAVARTHGDNRHGKAYRAEIAKVKALWDLEED